MTPARPPPGRLGGASGAVPDQKPSSGGSTMVVPPGNEGSDGPQLTSPLPRVAPAPDRAGRRGGRAGARPTGRRALAPLGGAARLRPPQRHPGRPRPRAGAVRAVLGLGRAARRPALEPLVRGRPHLPAGLPPPGADDRVRRHRRRGLRPVARLRPVPGRRGTPRRALHRRPRVRVAPRRRGGRRPGGRRGHGHRALGAGAEQRPVHRLPHRAGLHRTPGRGGGARAAQPARLAGRARRAVGGRARPAGFAGRRGRARPALHGRCTTWCRTTSR